MDRSEQRRERERGKVNTRASPCGSSDQNMIELSISTARDVDLRVIVFIEINTTCCPCSATNEFCAMDDVGDENLIDAAFVYRSQSCTKMNESQILAIEARPVRSPNTRERV